MLPGRPLTRTADRGFATEAERKDAGNPAPDRRSTARRPTICGAWRASGAHDCDVLQRMAETRTARRSPANTSRSTSRCRSIWSQESKIAPELNRSPMPVPQLSCGHPWRADSRSRLCRATRRRRATPQFRSDRSRGIVEIQPPPNRARSTRRACPDARARPKAHR